MDDDPNAFLDTLCLASGKTTKVVELRVIDGTVEDIDEVVSTFGGKPAQRLASSDDPETLLAALLKKFPDAQPTYARQVVGASRYHVEALLAPKRRASEQLLATILRNGGWYTPEDKDTHSDGAGGAVVAVLRDLGLVINKVTVGFRSYRYELDLRVFNRLRSPRNTISANARRRVLELANHQCSLCGSTRDLNVDHRVGVVFVGGAAAESKGLDAYQVTCRRCNNDKATACDGCPFFKAADPSRCGDCSWAYPENHTHTAGMPGGRVTCLLSLTELAAAKASGLSPAEWLRQACRELLERSADPEAHDALVSRGDLDGLI